MAIPDFLRKTVVIFDTETAVMRDHVIEVGFSIFKNTELVHECGLLIRPRVDIEPGAEAVHHISMRDVENEPTFDQVAPWCYNILNSADYHAAYNYEYDRFVFENEFERLGMKFPIKPMLDPLVLFRKWFKFNKGKKLTNAAERYGIDLVGAHRATNDSTATGRILMKMAATRNDFPKTPAKFIEFQSKLLKEQFDDLSDYFQRTGKEPPEPPAYHLYEVTI